MLDELRRYFKARKDIAFAFLYGSQAKGNATKLSDVDIAIYFYPQRKGVLEYEEEVFYPTEDEIWSDLEKLIHKDVELLVLNRVSASVAASAIRGIPLLIRDWGLYLDFMLIITRVAEDFMDFIIEDYSMRTTIEERD